MDLKDLTVKVVEQGERIAAHEEEIKTLFNQQKNIEQLADSTYELAMSVKELNYKVSNVDDRVAEMENEKRQKHFALWQIIMSALLGGMITYCVTLLLR